MIPILTFQLKMENFKSFFDEYTVGEKYESKSLRVIDNEEIYKWRVHLYPKGLSDNYKNNLSIHCVLTNCPRSLIRAEVECHIQSKSFKHQKVSCLKTMNQGMTLGWNKFIKTNKLIKKIKELNFHLDVYIKIWHSENSVIEEVFVSKVADVIINVGNKILVVDKNVLSARSSVFCRMLMHDFQEKIKQVIEIVGFDYLDIEQIIQFFYNNTIELHEKNVENILRFADMYDVGALKTECENYYLRNISTKNAMVIYSIAELYNAFKLQEKSLLFIVSHIKDLINTESYKKFANCRTNLLDRIVRLIVINPSFDKILPSLIK